MSNTRKGRGGATPAQAQAARNARATSQTAATRTATPTAAPTGRAAQPRANPLVRPLLLAGAIVIVLLVGWLLFQAFSPKPAPVVPSADGRISFVRQNSDSTKDLYVVNPDGSNQQKATTNITIEGVTEWSPDGRQMLLQASVKGISTVVRLDIGPDNRGSNPVELTADTKADSVLPAWSPDGKSIAFQSKRDGGDYQVFVMDRDGNNKKRLSDGKGYAGQPAWSHDGKMIAYVEGDQATGSTHDIYVVPATGGTPKKVTPGGEDLSTPRWSPDGKSIVYLDNAGDRNNSVMIMNADGTSPRTLVNQGFNKSVSFSPDGKQISFYSVAPPNGSDIFLMPVAGGATTNLTHLSSDDYQQVWSPDGTRLAWSSLRGDKHKIVVSDAAGTAEKVISSGDGDDSQPEWGAPLK